MHAGGVEARSIVRHVVIGALEHAPQAFELQSNELVAARGFDRLQVAGRRFFRGHPFSPTGLLSLRRKSPHPALSRRERVSSPYGRVGLFDHVTLDAIRLATKERDPLAALIMNFYIVDAGAPGRAALVRHGGQHVALTRRGDE